MKDSAGSGGAASRLLLECLRKCPVSGSSNQSAGEHLSERAERAQVSREAWDRRDNSLKSSVCHHADISGARVPSVAPRAGKARGQLQVLLEGLHLGTGVGTGSWGPRCPGDSWTLRSGQWALRMCWGDGDFP